MKATKATLYLAVYMLASLMGKACGDEMDVLWCLWPEKKNGWEIRGWDWCVQCKGEDGCVEGVQTVTQHANPNMESQRWDFLDAGSGRVQIRSSGTNLCLTRYRSRDFVLNYCSSSSSRQLFLGYKKGEKFAIQPYKVRGKFMTMWHRPKHEGPHDGEEIRAEPEIYPKKSKTLYWYIPDAPREYEELSTRSKKCSSKRPCDECQGDCNDDDDCKDGFKCWNRFRGQWRKRVEKGLKHPWSKVPGCSGWGEYDGDYCYDPSKSIKGSSIGKQYDDVPYDP